MRVLRPILTAILVIAFAQYGLAASAAPHAHAADDFHAVHVIALDTHDRGHHADRPEHHEDGAESGDLSGTGHEETGLHAHGAPHFNEADAPNLLIAAELSPAMRSSTLSTLPALRRAAPPFKPPRLSL